MRMIPARHFKAVSLVAGILLSAAALLSWTMTWFTVILNPAESAHGTILVTGEVGAPALAALGLAGLALVAALAIAGGVFRLLLGVLQAVIGASIAASAWAAGADPVSASAPLVTETTGISGSESVTALIATVEPTAWPLLAVIIGMLMVLLGIFVTATARRWPATTSRYRAARFDDADAPRSTVSDWDRLSDGSDPTSR